MTPAQKDITLYRGDTYELFARIKDGSGVYRDLTGWVGLAQYRATVDDSTVLATFSVVLGNQTTAPGSFFMRLTDTVTAALTVLSGVYDLQFTFPDGTKGTYMAGKVTVTKDVSRLP